MTRQCQMQGCFGGKDKPTGPYPWSYKVWAPLPTSFAKPATVIQGLLRDTANRWQIWPAAQTGYVSPSILMGIEIRGDPEAYRS